MSRLLHLLVSLSLHALLLLVFIFILQPQLDRRSFQKNPRSLVQPVLLDFKAGAAPSISNIRAKTSKEFHRTPAPKGLSLKRLGVSLFAKDAAAAPEDTFSESPSRPSSRSGAVRNGMNFAQSDPLNPLYQSIYTAIERNLTYPSEFTNRGIHGEVSATLVFSPNGEFQASLLRTRSTSKYLESLVRRALRTAFREPLSGKALHDLKTALNVDCFFSFRFVEHPSDENRKTNSTQLGSHMSFYREFQQSLLEWNVGPAHGLGPFIGLDVLWIPNKIAELLSKKAKVDPLEQYREDDSPSP